MDELTKASHKLAEEIYKQAAAAKQQKGPQEQAQGQGNPEEQPGKGNSGTAGGKGDDIIDADFKEEK